ncbi:MAG: pilus assembly protein PilM [Candidatus Omnitrophica bacterium]|nr:pilus assembly protein PilM [Candidatus Omnitrophota bacterium]MBU4149748.1 pilus assembly protein PilM [Candidatus Omnitrophota bacterium]
MKKTVGIDIGKHSIKLIELEDKKGHLEITNVAIRRIVDGDTKSALKDIVSASKLSLKRVNASLSGPSVIVRYIEMPPMKIEELRSAIRFEAEKYIPFNVKNSIIDCAVLDKASSSSQRVLMVAAKKDDVNSLIELFRDADLEIDTMDIDSFAFFNSFHRVDPENKNENAYALINIGARFSNMNIITKGNVYFTRDILWGGIDVTGRIKDASGLGLDDAEALKQKPAERRDEVVGMITSVLERFTSQVRMSFDYFESQFGKNVERIYISGGTAYLFNIVDFLKDNLGVDTLMWDPFDGINIEEAAREKNIKGLPAVFAVAVGLALRK